MKMIKNPTERNALRILGQRDMLYKVINALATRRKRITIPLRYNEINELLSKLAQDLKRQESKQQVREYLTPREQLEFDNYTISFARFAVKHEQNIEYAQMLLCPDELVSNTINIKNKQGEN